MKRMIDLEIFHFEAAKHCQGLPTNTSNYGALVTIGWKTLSAHCDIIRLLFMWRLLSLSMLCLYKRIFISRLIEIFNSDNKKFIGPTQMLVETCKKYGLLNVLKVSVMNGEYMSMCKWKKMVIERILMRDIKRISIACSLYKVLDYLHVRNASMVSHWWQHAFRNTKYTRINRTIIRILLNVQRYGFNMCLKCNPEVINSIEHVMFQCESTKEIRELYWNNIIRVCPGQLLKEIVKMNLKDRSKFILNGFNSNYIHEWNDLYNATAVFLKYVFKQD